MVGGDSGDECLRSHLQTDAQQKGETVNGGDGPRDINFILLIYFTLIIILKYNIMFKKYTNLIY